MRVDLFGLVMDAPGGDVAPVGVVAVLGLEHRLFDAVKSVPGAEVEPPRTSCS